MDEYKNENNNNSISPTLHTATLQNDVVMGGKQSCSYHNVMSKEDKASVLVFVTGIHTHIQCLLLIDRSLQLVFTLIEPFVVVAGSLPFPPHPSHTASPLVWSRLELMLGKADSGPPEQ